MNEVVHNENAIVVTGGPGAGKTTLLLELSKLGYAYVPEVARAIIRFEMESGGSALPWGDTVAYTAKMLEGTVRAFEENFGRERPCFFDRGLPDVLCYARLIGLRELEQIELVCRRLRYKQTVFVAPPWEKIYATDTERKQTFAEARATYELMVSVYEELGYRLVELPRVPARGRAQFVIDWLRK
jgi:predicted ATPase